MKKNEREKEQEMNEAENNLIARNESRMSEMKFEEGEPEKKKRNK